MAAILEDDTRNPTTGLYGPALARDVAQISNFRVTRRSAYGWARNLRFLTYDDADEGQGVEGSSVQDDGSFNHRFSCKTCRQLPLFPDWKPVTKFRVIQFAEEDIMSKEICSHYLAVSYCWRSDANGKAAAAENSYCVRVVEKDGSQVERINRAPNSLIDRAVDAARAHGFRLIWIDQECLPQDTSREQELGIQGMDMVYQRAHLSVGLFESTIQEQAHLDAVATVWDWAMTKDPSERMVRQPEPGYTIFHFAQALIEFLELFAHDLWNQRAWILQEAMSAANDLILLIRTAPSIKFGFVRPVKGPDPNLVPCAFSISMPEMRNLIEVSRDFLTHLIRVPAPADVALSLKDRGDHWLERVSKLVQNLDHLYPVPGVTTSTFATLNAEGGGNFGPRTICNAAVALSFLRPRSNHRPADRLAILANLCDYEIRLDTVEIERRFKSLGVCLSVLAFINGDISLLVPDVYDYPNMNAPIEGPSWALPFQEAIYTINARNLQAGLSLSIRNPNRYLAIESGLQMPAHLWNVDRAVDLTPIKYQWESKWKQWVLYQTTIEQSESESSANIEGRRENAIQLAAKSQDGADNLGAEMNVLDLNKDNPTSASSDDSLNNTTAARIRSRDRVYDDKGAQWMVGNIFVDTLAYLLDIGEAALAKSIWHTIRIDCAIIEEGCDQGQSLSNASPLPDDVAELLADKTLLSNPWLLLQLDQNSRGTFNQVWIIERIMNDGILWTGKYASESAFKSQDSVDTEGDGSEPAKEKESILDIQLQKQIIANMFRFSMDDTDTNDPEAEWIGMNMGAMVNFASWSSGEWPSPELKHMVAAFDVDGPCLIATPFDSEMERLPRPVFRSMATAWVVESIGDEDKKDGHLEIEPALEGKAQDADVEAGDSKLQAEAAGAPSGERLSVQHRVKGAWEIMEEARDTYTFV